jgi:hypothetical protein
MDPSPGRDPSLRARAPGLRQRQTRRKDGDAKLRGYRAFALASERETPVEPTNGSHIEVVAEASVGFAQAESLATATTCATVGVTDPVTGVVTQEVECSLATLTITRTKNAKFQNVSADLLFMSIAVDPTTNAALAACLGVTTATTVTVPLFNGCLQNFFWNYQNNGLELLQLRFYPA